MGDLGLKFNPIQGTEKNILNQSYCEGALYFATDTRKVFLDAKGVSKMPMGGNIGLFYGKMILTSPPVDGQEEFEFKITDIVGNDDENKILYPNVNDLILNGDGCFYKVLSSHGEGIDTYLITKKLTIAGSGGGGGSTSGGESSLSTMKMSRLRFDKGQSLLYQAECPVSFAVKVTDDLGDALTGNVGTYDLYINSVKKASGIVIGSTAEDVTTLEGVSKTEINTIDVGPHLTLGENINVKISVNGVNGGVITRAGTVSVTNMVLEWDYDETTVNTWDEANRYMDLNWRVSGDFEKTTHIIINDDYDNEIAITSSSVSEQNYQLYYDAFNLWHGAHKVEIYVTTMMNGEPVPTDSICKNIIIAKENDLTPIISCGLFETKLTQYNTVQIPIIIYNPKENKSNVTLIENEVIKDEWEDIENRVVTNWSYTPTQEGSVVLTIQSGQAEKSLTLFIEALNITISEVGNYKFRFKASEFSSNSNVSNWNSNGYSATFTSLDGDPEKFDWYNGGLHTERDENKNVRQYFCIKAGSKMVINYPLFATGLTDNNNGKCLKVIFKATHCKDYNGQVLKCHDGDVGLLMKAQNATFNYAGKSIDVPYCEDEYIEFELDIGPQSKRYIRPWLDGVPAGISLYNKNDIIQTDDSTLIEIGSNECDVYLYMIKFYEKHLEDSDHLSNFIADASNATEMVARFERNDILEDGEISFTKLAEKNPRCFVHLYDMPCMTTTKNHKVNCSYTQFHGSADAVLSAEDVEVKVQGTSSAAYGLAAFNLDSKFTKGFEDKVKKQHIDEWSMSKTAIPTNYFCTKVNVASSEGSNNAINQEWYNRFQPYQSVARGRKTGEYNTARDCMEFVPGVVFVLDNNKETNDEKLGGHGDNVFKDTVGYVDKPYYKMYSVGCMGNSKKNSKVLHDVDNPYECCVENGDNQQPGQWMTDVQGGYTINKTFYPVSISSMDPSHKTMCPDNKERDNLTLWRGALDGLYEFRYPDGLEELDAAGEKYSNYLIKGWYDFVHWMAHSNPQPAYERVIIPEWDYYINKYENEDAFNADVRTKYVKDGSNYIEATSYDETKVYYLYLNAQSAFEGGFVGTLYKWDSANHIDYNEVVSYSDSHRTSSDDVDFYFKKTVHVYGATNKKLAEPKTFGEYEFRGYKVPDEINGEKLNLGTTYQKDYVPVLKGLKINTYANTYTHDTYEYRMAKMLSECEQHMCMDSVVYHYLFIERHTMIDNVAKNTFWSTEDGKVWNLIKNYDNDTSDGNDNQGKLTLHYGIEPGDTKENGVSVFNAGNSVWLAFINGLYDACAHMYIALDNLGAWSSTDYLKAHKDWQSAIPERCWIEDYYRKYVRPYEVYGSQMFLGMHEGGKKTHQRAQYEKYQDYYISSKYFGNTCQNNKFTIRANGDEITKIELPVQLYADCYIKAAYGSGTTKPNVSIRCKRNEDVLIKSPITDAGDATIYLWPSNLYQRLGNASVGLNNYQMTQFESVNAKKLRTISLGTSGGSVNTTLQDITFEKNENLEEVYVANYRAAKDLDLTESPGLLHVDGEGSGFATVALPGGAPTNIIKLESPVTLNLSKLTNIELFNINDFSKIKTLNIEDIDRSIMVDKEKNPISSKEIVKNSTGLSNYKLIDVIWTVGKDEVNTDNHTINILEKLLKAKPIGTTSQQNSLTGTLTIANDVYSNNSQGALQMYETYSKAKPVYERSLYANEEAFNKDTRDKYIKIGETSYEKVTTWSSTGEYYIKKLIADYPNLDIIFNGATLHTVYIYDGNGHVQWKRKIAPGGTINSGFLEYGPNGPFSSSDIQQTSTAEWQYLFKGKWDIIDEGRGKTVELTNDKPLYAETINGDIHIHPKFKAEKRKYNITVKMKNPITNEVSILKEPTEFEYGTPFADITSDIGIPWVDSSSLELTEVYDFKGYSLVEDGTTILSSEAEVTGEKTLWAIFKKEDVRTTIHPEWFSYTYTVYKENTGILDPSKVPDKYFPNKTRMPNTEGYSISIKPGLILKGKITIPASYNNLPVVTISSNFASGVTNQEITHIFIEKDNELYQINSDAFVGNNNLKYFDFSNIRQIKANAFNSCKSLDPRCFIEIKDRDNLFFVGQGAFNGSFDASIGPIAFYVPGSISLFQRDAFTYLALGAGSTLEVGSSAHPTDFLISSDINYQKDNVESVNFFAQNSSVQVTTIYCHYNSNEDFLRDKDGKELNFQVMHLYGYTQSQTLETR